MQHLANHNKKSKNLLSSLDTLKEKESEEKNKFEKDLVRLRGNYPFLLDGLISIDDSIYGVKMDGTVIGSPSWKNIIAISRAFEKILGLKEDGTVVYCGHVTRYKQALGDWRDIVQISCTGSCGFGLTIRGKVLSVGFFKIFSDDSISSWEDIIAISARSYHCLGLRNDGTVVVASEANYSNKINEFGECNVSDWKDIVAISAGYNHSLGLRKDGTVVAVGNNDHGQCNVSDWRDIVAISAGNSFSLGLRKDGKVVATGFNGNGQCNVSEWNNIIAISAGNMNTVALRKDGTLLSTDKESDRFRLFENLQELETRLSKIQENITRQRKEIEEKRRIEEIKEEENRKKVDEIKRLAKERQQRRLQGVCQHCGGSFKGLFTKTCSNCGRKKDY